MFDHKIRESFKDVDFEISPYGVEFIYVYRNDDVLVMMVLMVRWWFECVYS